MNERLAKVLFFNSGFCRQIAYFAGIRSLRIKRFYSVLVYFEHPRHGRFLIDAGYGPQFFEATRYLPRRVYRWATPVKLHGQLHAAGVLRANGIDHRSLDGIFLSHYHADHIGGLRGFSGVKVIHRTAFLEKLLRLSASQQLSHGFLPGLLPADLESTGETIAEDRFEQAGDTLAGLRQIDYWGDGSLVVVDLPGHAEGHCGFVLTTAKERYFCIIDACWEMEVLRANRALPRFSRWLQNDYGAYVATQERLRALPPAGDLKLLACHCSETQQHVAPPAD